MGKLMVGVARILPICTLISVFLSGIATQPAQAKLGPISIRTVYTTDENQNNKIVFKPGDKINFHVDVDNTTASTFPVDIRFQVFTAFNLDPTFYGYDQTHHVDQMPVGLSRFYNPTSLPSDARIHLGYILRITVTESPCSGVDCDDDFGESRFSIQTTEAPAGTVLNLIVLVHGCCTDANDVKEWDDLSTLIKSKIDPKEWEVVVWDWHEKTPKRGVIFAPADALEAYNNATMQGGILANAIKLYPYQHVHFIGFSAGAKLIHEAATSYINDFLVRQQKPFIHLTFLDAFTPSDLDRSGQGSYGSLPTDYPNHYSEHYVDKTPSSCALFTDADLRYAFNFDVTDCPSFNPSVEKRDCGHQWPRYWYQNTVTRSGFSYGYPLSREGGNNQIVALAGMAGVLKLQGTSRDCSGDILATPASTPSP